MEKMFFVLFAVLTFIACSHKVITSTTSSPVPSKPDANAMYISDIKPVIEVKCSPCHLPDKGGFKASFANFDSASKRINEMIRRVQLNPSEPGYMPFKSKRETLTAAELASFKAWQVALGK